jgi:hypothetical protein
MPTTPPAQVAAPFGMVDQDDVDVGIVAPLINARAMSRTIWRLRLCRPWDG